ncbi:hypothetical protein NADFUDRAFT_45558 [Nadsonia fulvescens var. elongata DSM 6958]|uniref:Peptide hydrolase n=1 Tax=Nadsonia fulvescens var. elongata DSM 6958 TaxID=857566 RepID=A0A1E3PPU5_9ASCO|nr:hypothetical protein NADFUDRAFT_45558 [Nadsonia fulvescens var. elongata DSM 6958]
MKIIVLTSWLILSVSIAFSNAYMPLKDTELESIASQFPPLEYLNPLDDGGLLQPFLIVRIPGTENSTKVQNHVNDFFIKQISQGQNSSSSEIPMWKVTHDSFQDSTPIGDNITFTNICVSRDPELAINEGDKARTRKRLTLAAHYDSKLYPEGFIGAIDSAVPCAILMYVAKVIDKALTRKQAFLNENGVGNENNQLGLQILFLDGEEAFHEWTSTDSIYGARHLAARMENEDIENVDGLIGSGLSSIDTFVLLDLLGAANPRIPSYFSETHDLYNSMRSIQKRGRNIKGLFQHKRRESNFFSSPSVSENVHFLGGTLGDDHTPFWQRGVPVLHLIPNKFPPQWHHLTDDVDHLDLRTVHDWAIIIAAFTAEYLELTNFILDQ